MFTSLSLAQIVVKRTKPIKINVPNDVSAETYEIENYAHEIILKRLHKNQLKLWLNNIQSVLCTT